MPATSAHSAVPSPVAADSMYTHPFHTLGALSTDPTSETQDASRQQARDAASQFMLEHKQNKDNARALIDYLQSQDPGAQWSPEDREKALRSCQDIADSREYVNRGLAVDVPTGNTHRIDISMPIGGHHVAVAKQERIALASLIWRLGQNARRHLDRGLEPLRGHVAHLKEVCRALHAEQSMKICSQAERLLKDHEDFKPADVQSLYIAATLSFTVRTDQLVMQTADSVRRLVALEQDLKLREPEAGPSTEAHRRQWQAALDAVNDSRLLDAKALMEPLERMASQAACARIVFPDSLGETDI